MPNTLVKSLFAVLVLVAVSAYGAARVQEPLNLSESDPLGVYPQITYNTGETNSVKYFQVLGPLDASGSIRSTNSLQTVSNIVSDSGSKVNGVGTTNGTAYGNAFVFRPLTVVSLPQSATAGQTVWASDAVTSRGRGSLCQYDGSNWRTSEGVVVTANETNFVLNAYRSGLRATSPKSDVAFYKNLIYAYGHDRNFVYYAGGASGLAYTTGMGAASRLTATAANSGGIIFGPIIVPAANDIYGTFGCVRPGIAGDVTDSFWITFGIGNTTSTNMPANGAFFLYDLNNVNGHNVANSQNWLCVVARNSSYVYADSGLPATPDTTPILGVIYTTSTCQFYTNGVLAYENATAGQQPTGSLYLDRLTLVKNAGSNARHVDQAVRGYHSRLSAPSSL